jgi:hypothetical protein
LFDEVHAFPGYQLTIDLERQVIVKPQGEEIPFEVSLSQVLPAQRLDDIGLTLRHKDKIQAFEAQRLATKPWLAHTVMGRCSTCLLHNCLRPLTRPNRLISPHFIQAHWVVINP